MNPTSLKGVGLNRRAALVLGARAAAMLSLASGPLAALGGCAAKGGPDWDRVALVDALQQVVTPAAEVARAARLANADFVVRAIEAGLMGVRAEVLAELAADLERRATDFMTASAARQGEIVAALDRETFAAPAPLTRPWYPIKALILMSYYTSEQGMSVDLRYEPVPGRYDPDVTVDAQWRPLANDWSGVSVKKPIAPR